MRYQIENVLTEEGGEYALYVRYRWLGEERNKDIGPDAEKLLLRMAGELQRALSDHMAVNTDGDKQTVKLYFRREEEQL